MSDEKISRRKFLGQSSMAATTVVAGSSAGHVHAHDGDHEHTQPDFALRTRALVSVLQKKGLVRQDAMDAVVDYYENKVGPHIGAKIVARIWTDPAFRQRMLDDARAVARDEGFTGVQGTDLIAVENTDEVHNLVVCTLCSCYPWPVLGLPPKWYKDSAYRAQSVIDPRGVLQKFGLELEDDVEVRVWDSTAEVRYLVIPQRPDGTDDMTVDELAELVTRDSMIGAEKLSSPA